jgi:hypothetical protein
MRKCKCGATGCDHVQPLKRNSDVAAERCDRVAAVLLEGPLETVDSLAWTGARAAHQAEARTPVQPLRRKGVPVKMTRNRQSQKHTKGGEPIKGPRRSGAARGPTYVEGRLDAIKTYRSVDPSTMCKCHSRGRTQTPHAHPLGEVMTICIQITRDKQPQGWRNVT